MIGREIIWKLSPKWTLQWLRKHAPERVDDYIAKLREKKLERELGDLND